MVTGAARIPAFAGASLLATCPAARACDLPAPETGTVASVVDGETPKLTDGDPWPFVDDDANEALAALAASQQVELKLGGSPPVDRDGHLLAQVFVVAGGTRLWLQEALVAKGIARVYSFPDNRACVAELLAREAEARAKRCGLWGSSLYRVANALDLERLGRLTHSYQLVEGTVAAVGEGRGRIYLNFANDWRSDFTVSVDRKDAPAFAAARIDLEGLSGKRLRVRGFLGWRNGPMIEASHPEQIELLPEESKQDKPPPQPTGPAIAL